MANVCIVARPGSRGARELVAALRARRINATRATSPQRGYLNIGWGISGGDLNHRIPPNKLWELKRCHEAGVRTVPFTTNFKDTNGDRWFGRRLQHAQGRDIFDLAVGTIRTRVPLRDFWTKFIPKSYEYRIHVFNGLAVRSGTKVCRDGSFPTEKATGPIWNLRKGCQIRYEHPAPMDAKQLAKKAVAALGLDFAAVDVLCGQDGRYYFLEANTQPGLHGGTIDKYVEKIIGVV